MLEYASAPNHLGDGLKRYIEQRVPMGGFMTAVLENNLKEACGRADHINIRLLPEIVGWLYNEAPAQCWGSPAKVKEWLMPPAKVMAQQLDEAIAKIKESTA